MKPLFKTMTVRDVIRKDMVLKWNSVINTLAKSAIHNTIEISPVMAEKYKFDMDGLFREYSIPPEFVYPHIRVNGYYSSQDYDSFKLRLDILDVKVLDSFYRMFNR